MLKKTLFALLLFQSTLSLYAQPIEWPLGTASLVFERTLRLDTSFPFNAPSIVHNVFYSRPFILNDLHNKPKFFCFLNFITDIHYNILYTTTRYRTSLTPSVLIPCSWNDSTFCYIGAYEDSMHGMYQALTCEFIKLQNGRFHLIKTTSLSDLNISIPPSPYTHTYKYCVVPMVGKEGYWLINIYTKDSLSVAGIGKNGISKPAFYKCHLQYEYFEYIVASQDGRQIAISSTRFADHKSESGNGINLFDFNPITGIVSNDRPIENGISPLIYESFSFFCFSPSGKYLYVSDPPKRKIIQIDLSHNPCTYKYINVLNWPTYMSIGPDGRLYCMLLNRIFCICYPDSVAEHCHPMLTRILFFDQGIRFLPTTISGYKKLKFNYFQACDKIILTPDCDRFFTHFEWFSGNDSTFGPNAVFTFPHPGKYAVTLKGMSEGYEAYYTDTVIVRVPPPPSFTTTADTACQWVAVSFINKITADNSAAGHHLHYLWNFGDGSQDTAANPLHVFTQSGSYQISLIAFNDYCSDTFTQKEKIIIRSAAKAAFTLSPAEGCVPLKVNIENKVKEKDVRYRYTFGDGSPQDSTSSPKHIYYQPGHYLIHQYVYSPNGCITGDSAEVIVHPSLTGRQPFDFLVSVDSATQYIELQWSAQEGAAYYQIIRSQSIGSQASLYYVTATRWEDKMAHPAQYHYFYHLQAIDSCGNILIGLHAHSNIFLQGENENNQYAHLYWNAYDSFPNDYNVERKYSHAFQILSPVRTREYNDNSFYNDHAVEGIYRISLIKDLGISYSNVIHIPYRFILNIPNAFTPNNNAINDDWIITATPGTILEAKIYNRWGECIYQSSGSHHLQWNGGRCPADVYYYILKATDSKGISHYRHGTISLMR